MKLHNLLHSTYLLTFLKGKGIPIEFQSAEIQASAGKWWEYLDSLNEEVEKIAGKATDKWFSVNCESTAVARQKHAPCQAAGPGSISGRDKFPG